MFNDEEKTKLIHFGILGMRWGHRKAEENIAGVYGLTMDEVVKKNDSFLKQNPNLAIGNYTAVKKNELPESPSQAEERNKKIRNIVIGVGVGVTVAAGAYLYATHKKEVDEAVNNFLNGSRNKKLADVQPSILDESRVLSLKEQLYYTKSGLHAETENQAKKIDFIVSWAKRDATRFNPISDSEYLNLSDKEVQVKAGSIFERLTKDPQEILAANAYVSFDPDDRNRYRSFLPALRRTNGEDGFGAVKHHIMSMESLQDIRSPSPKERVDILAHLIDKNPEFIQNEFYLNEHSDGLTFAKKHYNEFATMLGIDTIRNGNLGKSYFEEVKRRGFNAIVDDNDAGRVARYPLMIFDPNAIKVHGIQALTKQDIQKAIFSIVPMNGESMLNTLNTMTNASPGVKSMVSSLLESLTQLIE